MYQQIHKLWTGLTCKFFPFWYLLLWNINSLQRFHICSRESSYNLHLHLNKFLRISYGQSSKVKTFWRIRWIWESLNREIEHPFFSYLPRKIAKINSCEIPSCQKREIKSLDFITPRTLFLPPSHPSLWKVLFDPITSDKLIVLQVFMKPWNSKQ